MNEPSHTTTALVSEKNAAIISPSKSGVFLDLHSDPFVDLIAMPAKLSRIEQLEVRIRASAEANGPLSVEPV